MLFKVFKFLFHPNINFVFSRVLKPFSSLLPQKLKIPVLGTYVLKVDQSTSIKLYAHYTSHLSRLLFWEGIKGWEYSNIRLFIPIVKTANVFFDIGANIGYYSLLASGVNPDIKTIAFEPFPDSFSALNDNIQLNGFKNIQTEEVALSDTKGNATFYNKKNKDFPNYKYQLAGDNGLIDYDEDERQETTVRTITLDEYLDTQKIAEIDLIKMDTETTEYFILKGGEQTLKDYQPIILCEVLKGHNELAMEKLLVKLNYTFYKVENMGLRKVDSIAKNTAHQNQYFFIPKKKIDFIQEHLPIL